VSNQTNGQLKSLVERIERLNEEKATISSDIGVVFAEAKAHGFDVKVLRKVIALRKLDAAEREEAEALMDTYMQALGMQAEFTFEDTSETSPSLSEAELNQPDEPGAGPLPEHTDAAV
jgi:uncharacterized protein (UPF0335 family)